MGQDEVYHLVHDGQVGMAGDNGTDEGVAGGDFGILAGQVPRLSGECREPGLLKVRCAGQVE
jgi:hypothetical protein